jgi:hypothetical protein
MTIRNLAEIGVRLEETVLALPVLASNAAELFDRYEEVAIAILDSEHMDFTPGLLEEYLQTLMYKRQLELNLIPFPDPREQ